MARSLCRVLRTTGISVPLLAVLTEGGLAGLDAEWGVDDVLLDTAGPAEVEARLRLAMTALQARRRATEDSCRSRSGDVVDRRGDATPRGSRGRLLDLTYKEFELLKYLAQHPGRVFTRAQLLQEVWGYDYYGGTRTVDVHVRRLRAKLGPEHEVLIGTVRNVGYRFVPEPSRAGDERRRRLSRRPPDAPAAADRRPHDGAAARARPDASGPPVASARSRAW